MQQIEKENLTKLGKRIKKLRLEQSKSLNRFVFSKGGITTATWSRIENGKFDAKFSTLIKVSALLGINLEELVRNIKFNYTIIEN